MGQFGKLQQRHQQVLEYLGCGEQGDDLLLNTLLQSFDLYLVTDTQGDIFHISPDLEKELGLSASEVIWRPIMQLMPVDQSACIHALFGSFFRVGATGAIQSSTPACSRTVFLATSGVIWRPREAGAVTYSTNAKVGRSISSGKPFGRHRMASAKRWPTSALSMICRSHRMWTSSWPDSALTTR